MKQGLATDGLQAWPPLCLCGWGSVGAAVPVISILSVLLVCSVGEQGDGVDQVAHRPRRTSSLAPNHCSTEIAEGPSKSGGVDYIHGLGN